MKGQFHEIILNVLRPFMVNDLVKIELRASKPNALEDNEIEEEEEEEEEEGDDGNDDDDDDLFVINVRLQRSTD